jgi:hypothetical protein
MEAIANDFHIPMKTEIKQVVQVLVLGGFLLGVLLGVGCKTPPPPLPHLPPPPAPIPIATSPLAVDDIPSDAPPAIRGHLIKLREMRDQGRISPGDYESRKALLLQSR